MKLDQIQGCPLCKRERQKGKTTYPPVLDSEARLLFLKIVIIENLRNFPKKNSKFSLIYTKETKFSQTLLGKRKKHCQEWGGMGVW
jgi:hypothetical protein